MSEITSSDLRQKRAPRTLEDTLPEDQWVSEIIRLVWSAGERFGLGIATADGQRGSECAVYRKRPELGKRLDRHVSRWKKVSIYFWSSMFYLFLF